MIGFAPGLIIHGLGHFYAGNNKAGGWLLVSEGISIIFMQYSVARAVGAVESENSDTGFSDFIGFTGWVMFFGGWIIDFTDAPIGVNKHNATIMNVQKISLRTRKGAVVVNYSINL
jgi:hypothetical protein